MDPNRRRELRIKKVFNDLCMGREALSAYNANQFLEGFYSETDPVACVNKVIASEAGLSNLQSAMRVDLSARFFNDQATSVLAFLQASPDLKIINGGEFLRIVLMKIVDPPLFWNAYREFFLKNELNDKAQSSFGWLLLQLCSLPSEKAEGYRSIHEMQDILKLLLASPSSAIRTTGQKIKHVLETCSVSTTSSRYGPGPGGRHDNDFVDFRKISILPTTDELGSMERAFIQPSDVLEDPETASNRVAVHLDNQFRLLREDMIYEMREELHIVTGKKKGHHRGIKIHGLKVVGLECGEERKRTKWGLIVAGATDIPHLKNKPDIKSRKAYLLDHTNIFKHQSLACLIVGKEVVAFPTINRNEDRLAKFPPEIVLQFEGGESTVNALRKLQLGDDVTLIQIDTALFSYEPILKGLQQATNLPLSSELLLWKKGDDISESSIPNKVSQVVGALRCNPQTDLKPLLSTPKTINLDDSQAASLISGLAQAVSLIQGPPGTGKSFIGTLIAKALYLSKTILVVCYTNHALDDILEGLLDIGIPPDAMLRLGGKSAARTEPLLLRNQARGVARTRDQWTIIDTCKQTAEVLHRKLEDAFDAYKSFKLRLSDMLDYLEFEHPAFYTAFKVPDDSDGMVTVGRRGRGVTPDYLLFRWQSGQHAGIYRDISNSGSATTKEIWGMDHNIRRQHFQQWKDALVQESIEALATAASEYNESLERLTRAQNTSLLSQLLDKRILGCTTTAAAKYGDEIRTFNPDVLLVEEAGEILESHILTALGPETSQLVLIGDHKQLRPKVNHYLLTVEKGDGYDLNRSLFERLILKNYPHERLTEQHRMRPEISSLIRNLTYPELVDAPKTKNRPDLMGVRDNLIFIDHENLEDEHAQLSDRQDMASTTSKVNTFEVEMVLKIVRYLGQQGYGTDKLVILTPYLGQLHKLRDALKKDNDPVLNDLDSYDLVKAGLINPADAKLAKKPIRLATIDNYQGEESDIVIVSLTRSNPVGDIGFMSSPERLNVLLSRARNALIMIGNAETFQKARKGADQWRKLFILLGHNVYNGFPVKCERHEDKVAILEKPEDFDIFCPDGGCDAKCDALLSCGHKCISKCHMIQDHSKMPCTENISSTCDAGHKQTWKCSDRSPQNCRKCERDAKLAKERQEQEIDAQKRRETEQRAHLARIDAINAEIAKERQAQEDVRLKEERSEAIKQKEGDLAALIASRTMPTVPAPSVPMAPAPSVPAMQAPTLSTTDGRDVQTSDGRDMETSDGHDVQTSPDNVPPLPPTTSQMSSSSAITPKPFPRLAESPSKKEWLRQKSMEGASNPSIDAIMDMTGLEEVKKKVLNIKSKIDVSTRQNASLKQERVNAVFLGNPGTGKTTVARHYAKFLAAVKVTPGDEFVETTGARLANEGVDTIKKTIENMVKAGGGTLFVDEAYQLTSGNSYGGGAVLDFLLAEMENQVGTIAFILAGYNREMEKFFEHNPGLKSRVPHQLQFTDYKDEELMAIFESIVRKTFEGRMKVEDGIDGLYTRILIRRLGRRRGQPGFGNARDLQIAFARTRDRQADRLNRERTQGKVADDFLFIGEDLIGPNPSKAIKNIKAWDKLQSMIGLQAVKEAVRTFFILVEKNFQREILELEPIEVSLNRVFLGSPGTGKTTVAKLYGEILVGLGLLSNGEVITKNPSDFVGAVLGASEQNTKAILSNAMGKVLIIDEAYMLYDGAQTGSGSNQFKTTVIDTMVAEIQSVPGEDRCVLLLGYRDQMMEMFQNINPGMSRRFKIEDAFNFEDFDDADLLNILNLKLKNQDLGATEPAKKVAIEMLSRSRNRPNFGNAGDVENLISEAKARSVRREQLAQIIFEPQDFDPNYKRSENAATNLEKLFEDVVGCGDIVERLGGYQQIAAICKARDMDPREQIPTNFVFTGPPGTGKTTVARKIGQVFYDMGILGSAEVVECSASDLVGQYVGHTGPKTKKLFEKALGKVLFIDEAYRLSQGHFAQEAIDELVGLITHPTFKSKLIIILAGYEEDMNNLMSVNTGLSSRFPDQIVFTNMRAGYCLQVVLKELTKKKVRFPELEDESSSVYKEMKALVEDLASLPNWGNARDMMTLSKDMISKALLLDNNSGAEIQIAGTAALEILEKMVADRERRSNIPLKTRAKSTLPTQTFTMNPPTPPKISTEATTASVAKPETSSRSSTPTSQASRGSATRGRGRGGAVNRQAVQQVQRDPNVSDAVWSALQAAIRAKEQAEQTAKKAIQSLEQSIADHRKNEETQKEELRKLQQKEAEAKEANEKAAILRAREKARLKEQNARIAREKAAAELHAKKAEERERREKEEKAQQKLRQLGVCSAGFRWIKVGDSGYRCAGGAHFVSASQLGL